MNTTRNHARLAELADEIHRLDALLLNAERAALDPSGTEPDMDTAAAVLAQTRVDLDRAFRGYFIEAEVVRHADLALEHERVEHQRQIRDLAAIRRRTA